MIQKFHSRLLSEFNALKDPIRAEGQQRYMKSQMPYFGIKTPEVKKITNQILKEFPIKSNKSYSDIIEYLFMNAKHREEWYVGSHIAIKYKTYIIEENLSLYLKIIKLTQWWDIIDAVATNLVGTAIKDSEKFKLYLCSWIDDENMWIRRTAILSQLKYKNETNEDLLYELILKCAHEKEFFIRKAIGWILREYSKSNPNSVKNFIFKNRKFLSNLSVREGGKKQPNFF